MLTHAQRSINVYNSNIYDKLCIVKCCFLRDAFFCERLSLGLEMLEDIANRLKAARKKTGLTQKQMSEEIGSSLSAWQDYETGKSIPGGNALAGLARLGVDINWLLTGAGEGEKDPIKILSATYHAEDYLLSILPQLSQIIEIHCSDRHREKGVCHLVRFKTGELQFVSSKMNCDRGPRIEEVEKVRHGMALFTHQLLYASVSEEDLLSLEKNPNVKVMEDLFGRAKTIMPLKTEIAIYKRWLDFDQIVPAQYESPDEQGLSGPIEEFLSEKRKTGQDTGWVSLAFSDCFPEFKEWLKKRQERSK